jgi:putative modified peptide
MADAKLTKEQGVALLAKLGHDDAFRGLFERKPAEAMMQSGIPAETICRLPAKCLCPGKLATKADIQHAHRQLSADLDTSVLALTVPTPKL